MIEARVFHENETSDGSMIYIPKQKIKYFKKTGLPIVYAKILEQSLF
jgi:transcription elongation factor